MDKIFADKTIIKFQKIFFGFALTKTADIREAEELTSRIILEAYTTLLKTEGVENWDGYLYRIAHFVYAKYLNNKKKNCINSIDELELPIDSDFTREIEKSEDFKLLKREIAYLGYIQRTIVVMHYYHNLKIDEIAKRLNLSIGTVKWHLHDARNQIKEGINSMRTTGDLGLTPISFLSMGHIGRAGMQGDTSYHLNSKLRQNIAYAAYDQPKTVKEIAEELGITPVYVEDEVNYLEEYGFLDKLSGGKYRTNIFITRSSKECQISELELLKILSEKVCDEYVPIISQYIDQMNSDNIYIPNKDKNYLLWSLIPYIMGYKVNVETFNHSLEKTNYLVKRKDGGEYIAVACLKQDNIIDEIDMDEHYKVCGDMTRSSMQYPVASWQQSTCFDSRVFGWQDNKSEDYEYLYQFISGKLPKEEALADKYQRLYDRGLVVNKNGTDVVNVIMFKTKNLDNYFTGKNELIDLLPDLPNNLMKELKETNERLFELQKNNYPEHMHKLLKFWNRNCLGLGEVRIMVLDKLIERGVLKLPNDDLKKGITTIVFSDIMPE